MPNFKHRVPELILKFQTPTEWVEAVLADFNTFLSDHASAEKKASSMAMTMVSHYPDRTALVTAMLDLAIEELSHFREVVKLIHSRKKSLAGDQKDHYVNEFISHFRKGSEFYFLDRLLIAGIIEARGAERFGLIANALPSGNEKQFYTAITRSEERHFELFLGLAVEYFPFDTVELRLRELLKIEAEICAKQPHRAALH